jgi:hypothetical protein
MKKLFTVLFAGLFCFSLAAQTDQGTFLLSGGTELSYVSQSLNSYDPDIYDIMGVDMPDIKNSQMELNLFGGYFLIDGLAAGLTVSYESETNTTSESGYDYKDITTTTIIAPTVRYYIGETGAWAAASYGFGSSNYLEEETDYEDLENNSKVSALMFGAGYAIYLADNVSINPSLGYAMTTVIVEDGGVNDDFETVDLEVKTSGLFFGLGLSVHLE